MLLPAVELNPVPEMVTEVLTGPSAGEKEIMVGACPKRSKVQKLKIAIRMLMMACWVISLVEMFIGGQLRFCEERWNQFGLLFLFEKWDKHVIFQVFKCSGIRVFGFLEEEHAQSNASHT